MEVEVAIVGGGLAGLFTASELLYRDVDETVVLEAGAHPGGVVRTIQIGGYSLEPAAGTLLLPHPHLSPVLAHIGAEIAPAAPSAAMRHVYTRGRLVAAPASPRVAFAPLVGWGAKFRAAAEPFVRKQPRSDDETLSEFLDRRLGKGLGSMVAWLAASGVFAGDPDRLSARAAFPALPALEDAAGSIVRGGLKRLRARDRSIPRPSSHVPIPDMTGLADAAASHLGERLRTGFPVETVRPGSDGWIVEGPEPVRAKHLVLACRPSVAGGLLGGEVGDLLRQASSSPVAVVWLGGSPSRVSVPEGFGALVGRDAGMRTLGILYESSYAPMRSSDGKSLAKVIIGGATNPTVAEWDDERLVSTVVAEGSTVLGENLDPEFTHVVRHREGIPHYEVGHAAWLSRIQELAPPGLHLTGWGYRGVGVAHVAGDAVRIADGLAGR